MLRILRPDTEFVAPSLSCRARPLQGRPHTGLRDGCPHPGHGKLPRIAPTPLCQDVPGPDHHIRGGSNRVEFRGSQRAHATRARERLRRGGRLGGWLSLTRSVLLHSLVGGATVEVVSTAPRQSCHGDQCATDCGSLCPGYRDGCGIPAVELERGWVEGQGQIGPARGLDGRHSDCHLHRRLYAKGWAAYPELPSEPTGHRSTCFAPLGQDSAPRSQPANESQAHSDRTVRVTPPR